MASRRLRSRAQLTAWLAVIVALFVFVAVSQVDDDAAASLRTTDFVSNVQLDQTLAARQAQLVPQAWLEFGSLVAAGVAIGIALLVQRHYGEHRRLRVDHVDALTDGTDHHPRAQPERVWLQPRR